MRNPGALLLAAPVVLGGLVASVARRRSVVRATGAFGTAVTAAVLVALVLPPATGSALPASEPAPVSAALFVTIGTAHDPAAPFTVEFDQPMDRASTAAALSVEPTAPFSVRWDAAGRIATLVPAVAWRTDTLYRVQVTTTARSADGGSLAAPLRSVVLTDRGGTVGLAPTMATATAARLDTSFRIRLDRPATAASVRAALRSQPPLAGNVVEEASPGMYRFTPFAQMAPGTTYRVWLEGLVDTSGVPFQPMSAVEVHSVDAPAVTSIRPRDASTRVKRGGAITVRFSLPMDEAQTEDGFHVTADGKAVEGRISWSIDGRTLVFRPAKALAFGARVIVTVDRAARSAAGADILAAARARFTIVATQAGDVVGIPTGAAGAVNGTWLAVERYYLKLMNCTRTGGWVTSAGACSSPGGLATAPLRLNATISSRVSRPYARLLARSGQCSHFIGGNPGDRLRAAGFSGYNWGENIGCRDGSPYRSVLGTHLFYQGEKPYNGGHYRNLMNPGFRQVGIGVWVSGGHTRLVIDFYGS
ncbi:MAG TPA: Ig-like domain-containing protein [Candidatus Limnocylindrales bacterium]